jgi:CBS domain-containing protein
MEEHQVRRVPVVDSQGLCIGMVAQADIALHDSPDHTYRTVAAISQKAAPAQVAAG